MREFPDSIIPKKSILLSRNRPVALVVGVAGFIGSFLAEQLLIDDIQVVGVDDLSTGKTDHLVDCIKSKDFHFIREKVSTALSPHGSLNLKTFPRLDYLIITASFTSKEEVIAELKPLLETLHPEDDPEAKVSKRITKILLLSSIDLYDKPLKTGESKVISQAELLLARIAKEYALNARVVRLAPVYGPRMNFETQDPLIDLIKAELNGQLHSDNFSSDLNTRALFIEEAISLALKVLLSGGTTNQIFDGALLYPYKVSEIKQLLQDPMWAEMEGYSLSFLPAWPTPNLNRAIYELSWDPGSNLLSSLKKTLVYFREHRSDVPKVIEDHHFYLPSFKKKIYIEEKEEESDVVNQRNELSEDVKDLERGREVQTTATSFNLKKTLLFLFFTGIVILGLFLPMFEVGKDIYLLNTFLNKTVENLQKGKLAEATAIAHESYQSAIDLESKLEALAILRRIGILDSQVESVQNSLTNTKLGLSGVYAGLLGLEDLSKSTKVISNESKDNPIPYYQNARAHLEQAQQDLTSTKLQYENGNKFLFVLNQDKWIDNLSSFNTMVDKSRSLTEFLPKMTSVEGKKVYLIMLVNNLELRPNGGVATAFARVEFDKGKIANITFNSISDLDSKLTETYAPPTELKEDYGATKWTLKDAAFDPDFPTSALQIEFLYSKAAKENINGVIVMDLYALGNLIEAAGGIDLKAYGEKITKSNLFSKVIQYYQKDMEGVNLASSNFQTAVFRETLNKVLFLTNSDWSTIFMALDNSLSQKHLFLFFSDKQLLTFTSAQNWAGLLPREARREEGITKDFLYIVDSNMGANLANYSVERSLDLETMVDSAGKVNHKLILVYKNNSPETDYPYGTYKNRMRIYLPAGSQLVKAKVGDIDTTAEFNSFTDHGRAGYSYLFEVSPKTLKNITIDYQISEALSFKDSLSTYKLDILKQPGTNGDMFNWNFNLPQSIKLVNEPEKGENSVVLKTNLSTDKAYIIKLRKP